MANIKITDLTAYTAPETTDVMPIVDVTTDTTKKVAVGEVVGKITGDVDVATDGTSSITAGVIVDADVNANAEIAVSKLADGTARQLLQTDAAGTGVEWTSNIDVPGTLDVTGATTLDSTLGVDGQSTLASAAVSDLTEDRVVIAGTSGELEDSANLTFNGSELGITGTLDVSSDATVGGDLTVEGNLTVEGTTTTIETTTLLVEDKNIEMGVVGTPTDITADGGGITLKGATDKTINWLDATDSWTSSENVDLANGKSYRINNTEVLSSTTLGGGVTGSSLTSVGTISSGTWQGTAIDDTYLDTISTAGKVSNSATTATDANTANAIVARDGTGNFSAGTITAALTGNADTATALSSNRTFAVTGDVTGTVSSDLTAGASIATSIAAGVIVNDDINASAAIADTKLATISTAGKVSNSATTATNANTASAIVARDASGNFSAGTITADLTGNADTATTLETARTIGGVSFDGSANIDLPGVNTAGNQDTSGNAATATKLNTSRTFAVTGDVTGTVSSDLTSGASIATSIAAGVIVDGDVSPSAAIAGTKIAPDFGSQTIQTTGVINAGSGTEAAPSVSVGTTDNGLYSPGTDQVAISTNGTERVEFGTSEVVFNDGGENYDFRVEGDTNSSLFFIDASADAVGIGTTTVDELLHVEGSASGGTISAKIQNNVGVASSDAALKLTTNSDTWQLTSKYDGAAFALSNGAGEKLRVDSSGRLLVGTSSSSAVTSIVAQGNSSNATGAAALSLARGTSSISVNDLLGVINFTDSSDNKFAQIQCYADAVTGVGDYPGRLVFSVTADGSASPSEAMRINNAGELLVGYTSDNGAYKLQVNSQIFATSAIIATSDGRYKENVAALDGCVDLVKALRPVSFDWKAQEPVTRVDEDGETVVVREAHNFPDGKQVGFIAQEVEEVLADKPWLGSVIKQNVRPAVTDADGNELAPEEEFLGIAEGNLVAVLTSALKDAIVRIESLEAEVAALKA